MADQNKVDPWASIIKPKVSTEAHIDKIENKETVIETKIESEISAKALASSSTRSGPRSKKPIVPRNDPKPIEPGRLETLPSYTPKNKIEDLKAQGKTFGGAEGKVQEAEKIAAGESAKEESHIVK